MAEFEIGSIIKFLENLLSFCGLLFFYHRFRGFSQIIVPVFFETLRSVKKVRIVKGKSKYFFSSVS